MKLKFIEKGALRQWLDDMANDEATTLVAPVVVSQEGAPGSRNPVALETQTLYKPVKSADEVAWDFQRTTMSPREFLFPHSEVLFTIETDELGKPTSLSETLFEGSQVIFGVRPCDARGLRTLEAVFGQEPVDTYFRQRRANTTLIGLACPQMWEGCFCNSVGGAPDTADDVDIMLTAVEDGYAVQVVTEKGQALLDRGVKIQDMDVTLPTPEIEETFETPSEAQWLSAFDDGYWQGVGERCLSCRICSFVCPTCRCFDVRDETLTLASGERVVQRVRTWESCNTPNYRTEASGHNSRPNEGPRLRNRFYCKFHYVSADYDAQGCVGCGRCVMACPVNIDIREVLRDVAQKEVTA